MAKKNKAVDGKSRNKNLNPIILIVFVILILYTIFLFFMLGWGFLTSIKAPTDYVGYFSNNNVLGLPNIEISNNFYDGYYGFNNYAYVFENFYFNANAVDYDSALLGIVNRPGYTTHFGHYIFNSLFYAGLGAFLYALITMTSGYLCSKYRYKFSYFLYTMLLVIMTIPLVGTQPATIEMLRMLGIYETYLSLLLMNMNFAGLYFFVFFAYFQGIPDTYMEAAEIDGASQFMIYLRIIIPLASKMMGTVFLIQFIALWNNYEAPRLYFPSLPTLAYALNVMSEKTENRPEGIATDVIQSTPGMIAACMIMVIPVLILFLALKNIIMGNITLGGLKE